jgi:hypothetical protein
MAEDVVRVKVTIPRELSSTNLTYGLIVQAGLCLVLPICKANMLVSTRPTIGSSPSTEFNLSVVSPTSNG